VGPGCHLLFLLPCLSSLSKPPEPASSLPCPTLPRRRPCVCCSPRAARTRLCAAPPSAHTSFVPAEPSHSRPVAGHSPERRHTPPPSPSEVLLPTPALLRPPQHQPRPPTGSSRVPHAPSPLPRHRKATPSPESAFSQAPLLQIATRGSTRQLKQVQGSICTNQDSYE